MSPQHDALKGAALIIGTCLKLRRGETFLLIHDETTPDFPAIFAQSARESGVEFEEHFVSRERQASGDAFDPALRGALEEAHGILVATSGEERCSQFRIKLTTDRRGATCQVATMPGATLEIVQTSIDIDYDAVAEACQRLTWPLLKADACRIVTYAANGEEHVLQFKLGGLAGRVPIQSLGIIPSGAWGNVPAGEIFIAPLEESAEGEFLINGAVGNEKLPAGREAILRFERGRLVNHRYAGTDTPVAELLEVQRVAQHHGGGDCWRVIAELGIGLNRAIPRITGIPLVDEKKYGTVHIAVGHNFGYGGTNNCPWVHCDMTTCSPSVELDGHPIIHRGEHVVDPATFVANFRSFTTAEPPANGRRPRVDPDAYVVRDGRLLIRRITSSGRETLYPVGDEETSALALRVLQTQHGGVLDAEAVQERLGMSAGDTAAVFAMLALHKVLTK